MENLPILKPGQTNETTITALLQHKGLTNSTTIEIIKTLCLPEPEKSLITVSAAISDVEVYKPGGGTQISKIRKELGERNLNTLLATLIFDLAGFYNIGGNITDAQVQKLVEVIKIDFWFLKIEQVVRAFHWQKVQNLVKIYNRLDPGVITDILKTYDVMFSENCLDFAREKQEGYDGNRQPDAKQEEIQKIRKASMQYNFEKSKNNNPS